jgi:hypothetical protein
MQGLILLYVGAVMFINGLTMLGRISPKESAFMNLLTGSLALYVCLTGVSTSDPETLQNAGFGLLFSFTYLWVAYVNLTNVDGRGLGWFSLFVATTAALVSVDLVAAAQTSVELWFAGSWVAWTVLWLCFFAIGALGHKRWTRPTAWFTLAQAVLTAWLPGYLLLTGKITV